MDGTLGGVATAGVPQDQREIILEIRRKNANHKRAQRGQGGIGWPQPKRANYAIGDLFGKTFRPNPVPGPVYAARNDFVFAQAAVSNAGGDSSGNAKTCGETKYECSNA